MLRQNRRRGACLVCREKKTKCDRGDQCVNCQRLDQECIYPEPGPRQHRRTVFNFPLKTFGDGCLGQANANYDISLVSPGTAAVHGVRPGTLPHWGNDNPDRRAGASSHGYYLSDPAGMAGRQFLLTPQPTTSGPLICADEAPVSLASHPKIFYISDDERAGLWRNLKPTNDGATASISPLQTETPGDFDDMELTRDMNWTFSGSESPSQVLESFESGSLDIGVTPNTSGWTSPTATMRKLGLASDGFARVTSPRPPANNSALSPSLICQKMTFSSSSFYGLRDAVCHSLGKGGLEAGRILAALEGKKSDASRAISHLQLGESQLCEKDWWTTESDEVLETYISAFSDVYYNFIPRADILKRIKEAFLPDASQLVRGFAHAVIALGVYCHRLSRRQPGGAVSAVCHDQNQNSSASASVRSDTDGARVMWRLRAALGFRESAQCLPSEVLKFQLSLLMASVALECKMSSLVTENIVIAAMHARELCSSYDIPGDVFEPALAYSYVLDVVHALDRGLPPVSRSPWPRVL
ncbi:hypothetical protein CGRA01v4_14158 [Colletotrichum graminicola]|nr:hypothetical protein CGRA01v4_14158 [Colletotrichum graminicola]